MTDATTMTARTTSRVRDHQGNRACGGGLAGAIAGDSAGWPRWWRILRILSWSWMEASRVRRRSLRPYFTTHACAIGWRRIRPRPDLPWSDSINGCSSNARVTSIKE